MANNQVKITGGSLDGSELTNAASEVTLAALLATMKTMARQSGPNSKKAAKELDDFTKSTKAAGDEIDDLSSSARTLRGDLASLTSNGFRILQQGIVGFASGLDNAANNLINFGADLIQSQPEITDFTSSLVNSRLNVLGLGTAVHRLTELMMGNYRSFQTLSQSGIFLGDRISSLQSDFASLGVDASTLNSALVENAHLFAINGASSSAVAKALDGMRSGIGNTRQELLSYGISLEEQTDIFTSMYARNTSALRAGIVTTDEINQQSATYAKSLRRISELTGVQARELEESQKRLDMEHAFQLYLDSLEDPEMANRLRESVAAAGATLGDAGRDMAMAEAMGTIATTDAAIAMQGYGNSITEYIADMNQLARDIGIGSDAGAAEFARATNQLANNQTLAQRQNLALSQNLMFAGETIVGDLLRMSRLFGGSIDDTVSNLGNLDETGGVIGSFTDLLVEFRSAVADISSTFFANETVQKGLVSFRNWLDRFTTNVKEFNITEFWEKYNPFNAEGRANMLDSFRSFWNGPDATALRDTISSFFEFLVEELILGINNTTGIFGGSARGIREERTLGSITETDTTAAVNPTTADLTESQSVYRNMLDQAVELQRNINTFQPMTGEGDVFGEAQRLVDEYQLQLDQLLEKLPSGAETDIESRALIEEYNRQMEISQDRMWRFLSTRETAAAEAANIANRLLERGIEVDTERRIGTLQATGFRSEPKDTVAQIHAGERVLNPEETNEYNNRSNQNNQRPMLEKLDQLNSTMMTVASLLTQELSIQTRTMNRISGLGPDLMKGMP